MADELAFVGTAALRTNVDLGHRAHDRVTRLGDQVDDGRLERSDFVSEIVFNQQALVTVIALVYELIVDVGQRDGRDG